MMRFIQLDIKTKFTNVGVYRGKRNLIPLSRITLYVNIFYVIDNGKLEHRCETLHWKNWDKNQNSLMFCLVENMVLWRNIIFPEKNMILIFRLHFSIAMVCILGIFMLWQVMQGHHDLSLFLCSKHSMCTSNI